MLGLKKNVSAAHKNYSDCSGCNLCLLVCPVWQRTRDFSLTPHGRAKALQNGARVADIAASIESCTLCMACEPVCPENIGLTAMLLDLRRALPVTMAALIAPAQVPTFRSRSASISSSTLLIPDPALRNRADLLSQISGLLGIESTAVYDDDGADIALALEAGTEIPAQRIERFVGPLGRLKQIIVADGLLFRYLRHALAGVKVRSLGEALSALPAVRIGLRASDLYVIESRAYHSDFDRLVNYYAELRAARGCEFNLDLQRVAIPATARSLAQRLERVAPDDDAQQGQWLLQGRKFQRIVVENLDDGAALAKLTGKPVVHLAEIVDTESRIYANSRMLEGRPADA